MKRKGCNFFWQECWRVLSQRSVASFASLSDRGSSFGGLDSEAERLMKGPRGMGCFAVFYDGKERVVGGLVERYRLF